MKRQPLRTERFEIRVSKEERKMAEEIARDDGVTVSDAIRISVRNEWKRRFPGRTKPGFSPPLLRRGR